MGFLYIYIGMFYIVICHMEEAEKKASKTKRSKEVIIST